MALKKSTRFAVAVGLAVFVGAAVVTMAIAARQPSQPADMVAVEVQPETLASVEPAVEPAVQPAVELAVQPAVQKPTVQKPTVARAGAKKMAESTAPAASAPEAAASEPEPVALATRATPATTTPAVESRATVAVQESPDVTIEGCLERDDDTFRLKDTSGENTPKSRSWRSGFLRKGSARIEVIDEADRLKLPTHVGQRVSVTGILVDREMHAHSLEFGGAPCK